MNFFILLCLASANIYAGMTSIIPAKTVTPLVDIFHSKTKQLDDKTMEVRVSGHNKNGEISKANSTYQMPVALFEKARAQSSAVFRMNPATSSIPVDGTYFMGTAFHIGENLVLTNQHVLSPDRSNTTECDGFQLHANSGGAVFACKKVHYCNATEDVCLIEMAPTTHCLNFLCSKKEILELKNGPALKLKARPEINFERLDSAVMSCIGNTMGMGIHFSQGKGIRMSGDKIYFFAPLRTGNSGGPLIGEDGLVWGVVKLESGGPKVSDSAFNIAENMEKVIELVREQLSNDAGTLKKFNSAVIE